MNSTNLFCIIKRFTLKNLYLLVLVIVVCICSFTELPNKLSLNKNIVQSIISVSGSLAGFLFTTLGILIGLPDNKFIQLLKKTKYMQVVFNTIIIGIISLLISTVLGVFNILKSINICIFIIGMAETFLGAIYLYKITLYSSKSNRS